jgi:site-specific DNA-methyltransferase (adenine-specific)
MEELSDESAHLIITSPPYWQLKDYGEGRQIGFNDSYSDYINHLNLVWHESYRVLHDGCRLCVNIGDQFARAAYYGSYRVMPIRTEIIKFCEAAGFDYMGAIIWQKHTSMNTTGGGTVMGSYPYPRNGIVKVDYEFILLFKKPGKGAKVSKEVKERSKLTKDEWNKYFSGHWNFPGVKQTKHLAMFPEELPGRLIKMFSFVGETVLDPFLGSGTTSLAALKLDRNSFGYEINEEYLTAIQEKLGWQKPRADTRFELVRQPLPSSPPDFDSLIKKLPYIYKPERELQRQVDPKKKQFGQKIDDGGRKEREEYRSVKTIESPELMVLDNGEKVKLIGVKGNETHIQEAILFLEDLVKGTKVYLKQEESQQYDAENNLLCYLYLKNRTFVNAHLIKSGYVDVDGSWDYQKRDKFLMLANRNDRS